MTQIIPAAAAKLKLLDLFSGIGGFSLGLERTGGFETVAFCEIAPKCRHLLAHHWPGVPIYDDICALTAERLAADGVAVDAICGGFPCQDISLAGAGAGLAGERSGLWRHYARLIGELRPRFVIVENVSALLGRGLGDVLGDLAALGYDAEWHVIPASGLGAPHERERVWIIATDAGCPVEQQRGILFLGRRFTRSGEAAAIVANDYRERELQSGWRFTDQRGRTVYDPELAWPETWVEKLSQLRGVDDGLSGGFSTSAAARFGNSVVPHIPELIGRAILEALQSEQAAA